MSQGKDYTSFIVEDRNNLVNFIAKVSTEMFDYIQNKSNSQFILFYKYITHSDLATFGKANLLVNEKGSEEQMVSVGNFNCEYKYYSFDYDELSKITVKKLKYSIPCKISLKL